MTQVRGNVKNITPPSDYFMLDTKMVCALFSFLIGGEPNLTRQYEELISQSFLCNATVIRKNPHGNGTSKREEVGTLDSIRVCEDVRHDFHTVIFYEAVCGMCPWLVIENTQTQERYVRVPRPTKDLVIRVIHDKDRSVAELHQCTGYINAKSTVVDTEENKKRSVDEEKFERERLVKQSPSTVKVVDAGVYVWPTSWLTEDNVIAGPLINLYMKYRNLQRNEQLRNMIQFNMVSRRLVISNDNVASVKMVENVNRQLRSENGQVAVGELLDTNIDLVDAPREAQRLDVLNARVGGDGGADYDPSEGYIWAAKFMAASGNFSGAKSYLERVNQQKRTAAGGAGSGTGPAPTITDKNIGSKRLVHTQPSAVVVDLQRERADYLSEVRSYIYGSSSDASTGSQSTSAHVIAYSEEARHARLSVQHVFASWFETLYTTLNRASETSRLALKSIKDKKSKEENLQYLRQQKYVEVEWNPFLQKLPIDMVFEAHSYGAIDDRERVELMRNTLGLSLEAETINSLTSKIKAVDKKRQLLEQTQSASSTKSSSGSSGGGASDDIQKGVEEYASRKKPRLSS